MTKSPGSADSAAVILVTPDLHVIVNLRDKATEKPLIESPDRLALFGGGIEPGETPDAAARREVEEETTLRLKKLVPFMIYPYVSNKMDSIVFGNIYIAYDIKPDEIDVKEGQGMYTVRDESELDGIDGHEFSEVTRPILQAFFRSKYAKGPTELQP